MTDFVFTAYGHFGGNLLLVGFGMHKNNGLLSLTSIPWPRRSYFATRSLIC